MSGRGSAGNVIAALCSFFIPGLGQVTQGRPVMATVHFCLAGILWFFLLGWLIHFWSVIDSNEECDITRQRSPLRHLLSAGRAGSPAEAHRAQRCSGG
jgi:TM2 domain-containing membrane protein YozV